MANNEPLTPQEIQQVESVIAGYGLTPLWNAVLDYLNRGYTDVDQVLRMVSNDPRYQQAFYDRFPAIKLIREENMQRQLRGQPTIPELTAAEYISDEWSYAEATRGVGASAATKENITAWIAGQVSPTEVKDRIDVARNYIEYNVNQDVRKELQSIYGLTSDEMVMYVLADDKSKEQLASEWELRQRQANVGAAARVAGIGVSSSLRDEVASSSDNTYTYGQASSMFSSIAAQADSYRTLGDISGIDITQEDLVRSEFNIAGGSEANKKKRKLDSQERARFSGSSGLSRTSLSSKGLGSR